MSATSLENPLWQYSLRIYTCTRVKGLSLELNRQHGMDTNMLLLGGFLGMRGRVLEVEDFGMLREKVGAFHEAYMLKLETLRQKIANDGSVTAEIEKAWQDTLMKTELAAEQVEQQTLWQHIGRMPLAAADPAEAISTNLRRYAEGLGVTGDEAVRTLSLIAQELLAAG